jgi:hypothetical protein
MYYVESLDAITKQNFRSGTFAAGHTQENLPDGIFCIAHGPV